jgi:hypothetical protein
MGDERVQNNGKRSNERVRPEAWQIKFPKEFFRRNAGAPVPPAARRKKSVSTPAGIVHVETRHPQLPNPGNPMMTYRKLMILAAFAPTLLSLASAADVAGKWKAEFDTQIGLQKYVYEFKVDGDKITGKAVFDREQAKGEVDLKDVKVSGDDISFSEPLNFDGQEIRIDYKGKVAGDEMKLTRQVGDFATEELVAKRVKEPPAVKLPAGS